MRVILERASARVRGSVIVKGGDLPPGLKLRAFWRKLGDSSSPQYGVDVDVNGRFSVESLVAGQYEFTAQGVPTSYPSRAPNLTSDRQTLTLADGQNPEITLVIDLASKDKSKDQ